MQPSLVQQPRCSARLTSDISHPCEACRQHSSLTINNAVYSNRIDPQCGSLMQKPFARCTFSSARSQAAC